ncbi:translation machinery-associated protein 20 [Coemansia sp. RSA 1821]|nr:translation machinery-associated protein 20 [Coemansia sp. RSA 1821]
MSATDGWQYVVAGVAAAVATYRVLEHVGAQTEYECEFLKQARARRRRRRGTDWQSSTNGALRTASVAQLALHADSRQRRAAAELLYDSAARGRVLALAVKAAQDGEGVGQLQAVQLLRALAQAQTRHGRLERAGAVAALVQCMKSSDKAVVLEATATLKDMAGPSEAKRIRKRGKEAGVLEAIAEVLTETQDAAVAAGSAALARIYAQHSQFHGAMVRAGMLKALLRTARRSSADVEVQRVVLESLVRLSTSLGASELEQLLANGAGAVVAASIRYDDQSVASWGVGLLHELVSRGVGVLQLASSPGLVRWLCRRLSTVKYAYTNQLILRSLWCLTVVSPTALAAIADPPSLRRVLAVFATDDSDAHSCGVVLVSRVATLPRTHAWIVASPVPRALRDMVTRIPRGVRQDLLPEIAEFVSRLCHSAAQGAQADLAATCELLLGCEVEQARLAAVLSVINSSAAPRDFARQVASPTVRTMLIHMVLDFTHEHAQLYAAKGLAALLPCRLMRADTLVSEGFVPFVHTLRVRFAPVLSDPSAPTSPRSLQLMAYFSASSVLLFAMQVLLASEAQAHGHALATRNSNDACAALFGLQNCLLSYTAICLGHLLDIAIPEAAVQSHAMRNTVNALVAAYYKDEPNDPHARAASADARMLERGGHVRHTILLDAADTHDTWPTGSVVPRLRPHLHSAKPEAGSEEANPESKQHEGILSNKRLQIILPPLRLAMGVLADSLNSALVVQHPVVARQALHLARIVCRELPELSGIALRVLGSIDVRMLSAADAAGLLHLCSAYLKNFELAPPAPSESDAVDMLGTVLCQLPDAAPAVSADQLSAAPNSLSTGATIQSGLDTEATARSSLDAEDIAALPPCVGMAEDANREPAVYFQRYPECKPATIKRCGQIYAQLALDRYAAGWRTCEELYACAEPASHACWMVDRSGPRGACIEIEPTSLRRPPEPLSADSSGCSSGSPAPLRPPSPFLPADSTGPRAPPLSYELPSSPAGTLFHTQPPFYPSFVTLADGLTVWNNSWKFESVRMRTGVDGRLGGTHRFHVRLLTGGLIQIGWCSSMCTFYPESGEGVGDDFESVAYDGHRRRKWFGTAEDVTYGESWKAGDVITCELDLDNGRVVFFRNGRSMGLAFGMNERGVMEGGDSGFQGLSRDRTWYPAFSLASEQGLVFLGGDDAEQQRLQAKSSNDASTTSDHSSDDDAAAACVPVESTSAPAQQEQEQPSTPKSLDDLRTLGVAHAFRIRFEFQDLDSFPCIALDLPKGQGQIILGPNTEPENLSTYLQPEWWAVWSSATHNVHDTQSSLLRRQFSSAISGASDPPVEHKCLTRRMASDLWVCFAVLSDGRVCMAAVSEDMRLVEPLVVFDSKLQTAGIMFKKFNLAESISGKTQVKASTVRSLRTKLVEQFPQLEPHVDEILPKKSPLVQIKCKDHIMLYSLNNQILFFQHFDDPITPTLHLLHQFPTILPQLQVDRGAIKFVLSGANIMCPGLTSPGAKLPEENVEKGTIVAIMAEGKQHALAIGITTMSTDEIKSINRGNGVDLITYLNDPLWKTNLD